MKFTYAYTSPRDGTRKSIDYDTFRECLTVASIQADRSPTIIVTDPIGGNFRAARFIFRGTVRWLFTFAPQDIYKSLWCRAGERAGVRYASHRTGYVASERAMWRFLAEVETMIAVRVDRERREDAFAEAERRGLSVLLDTGESFLAPVSIEDARAVAFNHPGTIWHRDSLGWGVAA
jgi:hypothetical protein